MGDAGKCLARLPADDFVLVPERDLVAYPRVSGVVRRLLELTEVRRITIPYAGQVGSEAVPVSIAREHRQ
jgi:hypothetical protein